MKERNAYSLLLANFLHISLKNIRNSVNVLSSCSYNLLAASSDIGVGGGVGALGNGDGDLGFSLIDLGGFNAASIISGPKNNLRLSEFGGVMPTTSFLYSENILRI